MPIAHLGSNKPTVKLDFEDAKPFLAAKLQEALEAEAAAEAVYAPWKQQLDEIQIEVGEHTRQLLALSHDAPRTVPAEAYFSACEARDEARTALIGARNRWERLLRQAMPYANRLARARGAVKRARNKLDQRQSFRDHQSVPLERLEEMGVRAREYETKNGVRREVPPPKWA